MDGWKRMGNGSSCTGVTSLSAANGQVGDRIRFTAGTGPNGKLCALEAAHLSDGGRFGFLALLFLASLLVLPALAIARLPIDLRVVSGYAAAVSIAAYWAYARDKARANEWRVSEATLHFLELIGGWPGAFVAQRRLRHKCSKLRYQAVFWAVVVAYQVAAFDSLQSWKFSKAVAKLLS
jgi:uncharacterized membrane protein YsdA (DUF1294 family)